MTFLKYYYVNTITFDLINKFIPYFKNNALELLVKSQQHLINTEQAYADKKDPLLDQFNVDKLSMQVDEQTVIKLTPKETLCAAISAL